MSWEALLLQSMFCYETFMAFGIYAKNGYLYLGKALAHE